jgi:hypothetical protein
VLLSQSFQQLLGLALAPKKLCSPAQCWSWQLLRRVHTLSGHSKWNSRYRTVVDQHL